MHADFTLEGSRQWISDLVAGPAPTSVGADERRPIDPDVARGLLDGSVPWMFVTLWRNRSATPIEDNDLAMCDGERDAWLTVHNAAVAARRWTRPQHSTLLARSADHRLVLLGPPTEPMAAGLAVLDADGAVTAWVSVAPDRRGEGGGRQIWADLDRWAAGRPLQVRVETDDGHSVAFAELCGLALVAEEPRLVLDLATAPPPAGPPDPTLRLAVLGDKPTPVTGMWGVARHHRRPDGDLPGPEWDRRVPAGEQAGGQRTTVAVRRDEVQGYAMVLRQADRPGVAAHVGTFVHPDATRGGVARATKVEQITWARRAGLERLEASFGRRQPGQDGALRRARLPPDPGLVRHGPTVILGEPDPDLEVVLVCFAHAGGSAASFTPWRDAGARLGLDLAPGRAARARTPPPRSPTRRPGRRGRRRGAVRPGPSSGPVRAQPRGAGRPCRGRHGRARPAVRVGGPATGWCPAGGRGRARPKRRPGRPVGPARGHAARGPRQRGADGAGPATFRADAEATAAPPLGCPVRAHGGTEDPMGGPADLDGWVATTTGPFTRRLWPGDHFYLAGAATALLTDIATQFG